ncbi:MAG: Thermophilic serine proteinase precursor [Pelotomaculum sp. PtaU1.Bin035]|nr:MAG: Thermophilic serine proteinase precursor [Pelotomaculum sp. PtaU1.Bin035]
MKMIIKLIIPIMVSILSFTVGFADCAESYAESNDDMIQAEKNLNEERNELIIQYKENCLSKDLLDVKISSKLTHKDKLRSNIEIVSLDKDIKPEDAISELRKDEHVLYVEENIKLNLHAVPNDPMYSAQWGLKKIMAEEGWALASSAKKTVVVAVIDSGVDMNHPDLKNRIASGGYNFILNNSYINDINGHGTEVSGVIAAETNNNAGIAGVAGNLDIKILPLITADFRGNSFLTDLLEAIDYAIEENVDVINISMGGTEPSNIEKAAIQEAIKNGIVVVASAGNSGKSTYEYPASYDNVISVGSISESNIRSDFSNYNDKLDLVAPGESIYTCEKGGNYDECAGTSFSAPMVSGVAAILKAIDNTLSPSQIENIIETSAIDQGSAGKDNDYGYGVLNLYNAVKKVADITAEIPVTGINLDKESIRLTVGDKETLRVTISPSNASNQAISWASDNPSVASVDSNGVVTAIGAGNAIITVITADGGKTATCNVIIAGNNILLSEVPASVVLTAGGTQRLSICAEPADAKISYKTSNSKVATVTSAGLITAKKQGNATITVTGKKAGYNSQKKSISITVNAKKEIKKIIVEPKSLKLKIGENAVLKTTGIYNDGTEEDITSQVTYNYCNKKAFTIEDGMIIAKSAGSVRIYVKYGKLSKSVMIKVSN